MDSALHFSELALESRKGHLDQYYLCYILNNLGEIHLQLGDHTKALELALESEKEAIRTQNNSEALSGVYLLMYKCYKAKGDFKKALDYKEQHEKIEKSTLNDNNKKALFMQQAHHAYARQKALDDADSEKQIALERKEKEKNRIIIYFAFAGVILLAVFLAFIFNRLKLTRMQKDIIEAQKNLVEEQKKLVEEKQTEILDSIHYARRIQMAQVPSEKRVHLILSKLMK